MKPKGYLVTSFESVMCTLPCIFNDVIDHFWWQLPDLDIKKKTNGVSLVTYGPES